MFNNDIYNVLLIVLVTASFVALFIPIVKKIANHINAIDIPNERKVHKKPMPRLGGIGIFGGFLLGYMIFGEQSIQMNSILIGSFIILLTGIFDDIKPLSSLYKLVGQVIAALIITFYGKILLDSISAFGFYIDFDFLAYPITILFIVSCVNIINLIDGLDGLSGGISAIFFLTTGIICFARNMTGGLETTLTFIMLGSTLGFLVHNFYPAKIFAGDSGSMFLGFIIAVISLLGFKGTALTSVFVPLLILAIPILDTLFAIIRRLLKHQHIYTADKEHLHHQLLGMNFSHRNTVLIIYAINILFATSSIFYTLKDAFWGRIIYSISFVIVLWFVLRTGVITDRNKKNKKKCS